MGFFDTFKVMKDIVVGGIESYKAGEKLDELIQKATFDYDDVLTAEDKSFLQKYKQAKKTYDDNTDSDKNNDLLKQKEDVQLEFLESLTKNLSLPKSFRNEIVTAIEEFKKADNLALESLGEVLEKNAETDEQRAEIKRTLDESKRK